VRAHSDALTYLRAGGASVTLNCGYGHGFSALEVVEAVKRVSGVDFKFAGRRAGDPAQVVGLRPSPRFAQMAAAFRRLANHRVPRVSMGAHTFGAHKLTSNSMLSRTLPLK
jgi:UDP-glucose 4-epimerase